MSLEDIKNVVTIATAIIGTAAIVVLVWFSVRANRKALALMEAEERRQAEDEASWRESLRG